MARRRRRAVGTTGAISAFLTFGIAPLAQPATAHADGFDAVIDQALDAIAGSSGGLSGVSATAASEAGTADVGSVAAASPADGLLHTLEQGWNGTALTQQLDTTLRTLFDHVAPAAEAHAGGGAAQPMSPNLLVNPHFETADPDGTGYNGVTIPG